MPATDMQVTSATIAGLSSGGAYSLLRFDDYTKVPSSNFISGPYAKRFNFAASAATTILTPAYPKIGDIFDIKSNGAYFYRVVACTDGKCS